MTTEFRVYTRHDDPNKETYTTHKTINDLMEHLVGLRRLYGIDFYHLYTVIIKLDDVTIRLEPDSWHLICVTQIHNAR